MLFLLGQAIPIGDVTAVYIGCTTSHVFPTLARPGSAPTALTSPASSPPPFQHDEPALDSVSSLVNINNDIFKSRLRIHFSN